MTALEQCTRPTANLLLLVTAGVKIHGMLAYMYLQSIFLPQLYYLVLPSLQMVLKILSLL